MFKNFFLGHVPFVLCSLLAPEAGAGGGGAASSTAPNEPEKRPEPEGDTPELKFSSAVKIIGTLWDRVTGHTAALGAKDAENARIQGIADKATGDFEAEKAAHTKTTDELATEKTAHSKLQGEHATLAKNFGTLEKLAGVQGIDVSAALVEANKKAGNGPAAGNANPLVAEYMDLVAKEKSGDAKAGSAQKFYNKNKAKLDEHRASIA